MTKKWSRHGKVIHKNLFDFLGKKCIEEKCRVNSRLLQNETLTNIVCQNITTIRGGGVKNNFEISLYS